MGARGCDWYFLCDSQWPIMDDEEVYEMYIEKFVLNLNVVILYVVVYTVIFLLTLYNYKIKYSV